MLQYKYQRWECENTHIFICMKMEKRTFLTTSMKGVSFGAFVFLISHKVLKIMHVHIAYLKLY